MRWAQAQSSAARHFPPCSTQRPPDHHCGRRLACRASRAGFVRTPGAGHGATRGASRHQSRRPRSGTARRLRGLNHGRCAGGPPWAEAFKTAPDGVVTAKQVAAVVAERMPETEGCLAMPTVRLGTDSALKRLSCTAPAFATRSRPPRCRPAWLARYRLAGCCRGAWPLLPNPCGSGSASAVVASLPCKPGCTPPPRLAGRIRNVREPNRFASAAQRLP